MTTPTLAVKFVAAAEPAPWLDTTLGLAGFAVFCLAADKWGVLPVYLLVSPLALLVLTLLCAWQRLRLAEALRAAVAASNSALRAAEAAQQAATDAAAASAAVQAQRR